MRKRDIEALVLMGLMSGVEAGRRGVGMNTEWPGSTITREERKRRTQRRKLAKKQKIKQKKKKKKK